MLATPLLAYALYHAYRDRHKVRARRAIQAARRNPYSHADMLSRAYGASLARDYAAQGQLYAGWIKPEAALKALRG